MQQKIYDCKSWKVTTHELCAGIPEMVNLISVRHKQGCDL